MVFSAQARIQAPSIQNLANSSLRELHLSCIATLRSLISEGNLSEKTCIVHVMSRQEEEMQMICSLMILAIGHVEIKAYTTRSTLYMRGWQISLDY